MRTIPLLVLSLLLSLVEEVYCQQTYPHVFFRGQTLAGHSYVDLSLVGSDNSDSVVCHTDLSTCCSGAQGTHRGSWYFPNGTVLPFIGDSVPIGLGRTAQIAVIRRTGGATEPTGIYRCHIATIAVHHYADKSWGETVYVGLYPPDGIKLCLSNTETITFSPNTGGDITISGGEVIFDSDQITLTCISTGGPATTVTWTRDSITVTEGTETELDDPETAQYTHTLNVTTGGEYTCTVSNNKPSSDSANIILGSMSFAHPQITNCQLYGRSCCIYHVASFLVQVHHLPVEWQQSRMVPLVSESPGLHPVMPLATGSNTLEEAVVAVWLLETLTHTH